MKYKIGDIIRRNDIPESEYPDVKKVIITAWEEGCYVFGDGTVKHKFAIVDNAKWLYKAGNILAETLAQL